MHTPYQARAPGRHRAALIAHVFWLEAGFVGLSLLAGGAASHFESAAPALQALLCVAAGTAIAALSWNRAAAALHTGDAEHVESVRNTEGVIPGRPAHLATRQA